MLLCLSVGSPTVEQVKAFSTLRFLLQTHTLGRCGNCLHTAWQQHPGMLHYAGTTFVDQKHTQPVGGSLLLCYIHSKLHFIGGMVLYSFAFSFRCSLLLANESFLMITALMVHTCICVLSQSDTVWTRGALPRVAVCSGADSLGLQMSSPHFLAGSESTSRSLSLNARCPFMGRANLYLLNSSRGFITVTCCPVVLNRYLHLFTIPWLKAEMAAQG